MKREPLEETLLSRRDLLKAGLNVCGLVVAHGWLASCASLGGTSTRPVSQGGMAWASGGTRAMAGNYPDPFRGGSAEPCVLTPYMTAGPCHAATPVRRDISDGLAGLPLRLSLRVVRADRCEPVANAVVDVWHASPAGNYSAFPAGGASCNRTDPRGNTAQYCRGTQTTDADGRVDFDTVFPGWYPGRTVHIHFTVRLAGQDYLTSQLFFDDALTSQITSAHPDYRSRSLPDTTNRTDGLASSTRLGDVLLQTARMSDGAMQAWKTIAIPSTPGY
ncbi:MAG TPA: hypothetical protein V6D05_06100 [Stenomitos sp.]